MPWKCPSCGRQNYGTFNNCLCGYFSNETVLTKRALMDHQHDPEGDEQCPDIPANAVMDGIPSVSGTAEDHDLRVSGKPESIGKMLREEVVKEIDSWLFKYSSEDNCIAIGTPALQSFKLKLSLKDLEDLLEVLYQRAGKEKTTRKLSLVATDMASVIDRVDRMIEEKRSKVFLKFSGDELQEIADFINLQLKI